MVKLWLDDIRDEPKGWTRAYTASQAIKILEEEQVEFVSLDHDLGFGPYKENSPEDNMSGMDVVNWLIKNPQKVPPHIVIHSHNWYRAREMANRLWESNIECKVMPFNRESYWL